SEEMNQDAIVVTVTPTPSGLGDPTWSNGNKTATLNIQSAASTNYSVKVFAKDLAGNNVTAIYTYGSLCFVQGIVQDSNGNVLSGASITITSTLAGGPTYTTTSSDTGSFGVLAAAGNYNVKVTKSNYNEVDKNGVAVGQGLSTNNLGTLKMGNAIDWTIPIIIIVIGIIIIIVLVVALRARKK
ncbi:MAG TPA: carboxypeptidase-like regulatory domain-containing protein, partial [Methanomassiliicoccales archaeon]|nr:carboxypeptidase-like regulatory domain-containing protein [Methanomassiliicoccales archaeon]